VVEQCSIYCSLKGAGLCFKEKSTAEGIERSRTQERQTAENVGFQKHRAVCRLHSEWFTTASKILSAFADKSSFGCGGAALHRLQPFTIVNASWRYYSTALHTCADEDKTRTFAHDDLLCPRQWILSTRSYTMWMGRQPLHFIPWMSGFQEHLEMRMETSYG
jgi:hypothetical protein